MFVVRTPRRDQVFGALRTTGIQASIHYSSPIHLQPACHHLGGRPGQFARAEELSRSILSLPLFPGVTSAHIESTVMSLIRALSRTV